MQKLEVSDIAQRVTKPERYVARRLALTNLIAEARTDLREDRITLAHALDICRLAPEMQSHALAACYESKIVFDRDKQTYSHQPDKTKACSPRSLLAGIFNNTCLPKSPPGPPSNKMIVACAMMG